MYFHLVDEGEGIRLSGALLEYSDNGPLGANAHRDPPARRRALSRRDAYPGIFLNYRRDDTEAYAGRLHESLTRAFVPDPVFMDQFSVYPGEHWEWTIQQAVAHALVVICVIGPRWLDAVGNPPARRIDSDRDILRRELVAALDLGTPVIPLIVPRGVIPDVSQTPGELSELAELQVQEISARHWAADIDRLNRDQPRARRAG